VNSKPHKHEDRPKAALRVEAVRAAAGASDQDIWLAAKSQLTRFQNASRYFGRALR